jgi:hypothetical protein
MKPIKIFFAVALSSLMFAYNVTASSAARGSQALLQGAQAEALISSLENALWIPDGTAADKQIYIVYSTACGFCKKFFGDSRALTSKVQFRWVTHCCIGYGGEYVAEQHTPAAIGEVYAKRGGSAKNMERAKREIYINVWASNALPKANNIFYPTFVYRTANGVVVNYGAPADLKKMVASVVNRPDRANYRSQGQAFLDKTIAMTPPGKLKQYVNKDQKNAVPMYAQPDITSQKVEDISFSYGYPVIGIANKEWITVPGLIFGGTPIPGYIHAPLEIKLAQLEFKVRPTSGVVRTNKSTDIRLHPDMDSPVVDKLEPGYQMNKSGDVSLSGKQWTEVILYDDGTKGYLLQ